MGVDLRILFAAAGMAIDAGDQVGAFAFLASVSAAGDGQMRLDVPQCLCDGRVMGGGDGLAEIPIGHRPDDRHALGCGKSQIVAVATLRAGLVHQRPTIFGMKALEEAGHGFAFHGLASEANGLRAGADPDAGRAAVALAVIVFDGAGAGSRTTLLRGSLVRLFVGIIGYLGDVLGGGAFLGVDGEHRDLRRLT